MTAQLTEQKRFYWLDWLRFAAAFAVLTYHTCNDNWFQSVGAVNHHQNYFSWIFFQATNTGIAPVVVFFVLSGFLVGGKVLERLLNGTFDANAYAIDRISRIYVPLLPALLFTVVVCLVCGSQISIGEFFGNLFGLQGICCSPFAGNAPLWSLAYEFWFYLLAGYIGLFFGSANRVKGALLGVTLVFIVFTKLDASLLFCWCLGAFGYSLIKRSLNPAWFFSSIMLTLVGYGLMGYLSDTANTKDFSSFCPSRDAAILILGLGLALLLPFLAQRPPRSRGLVAIERAGTKLAAFSYTLYLTHWPLLRLGDYFLHERFTTLGFHTFLWFIAKLLACLLVAWLLYLPFEGQTARVRNWMKRQCARRTVELYPIKQNSAT